MRIELTESGHEAVQEVSRIVFKYLDLLKAPGGINEQVRSGSLQGFQLVDLPWPWVPFQFQHGI